jgi:uridylate kinase
MSKTYLIKLGGSLVVPEEGKIDEEYLLKFKNLIEKFVRQEGERFVCRFIIVVGGGWTSRWYQQSAERLGAQEENDLHWVGIMATWINAELLRSIFNGLAHPSGYFRFDEDLHWTEPVLVAGGWKPGCSTDNDAAILAEKFNAETIIMLSNIDYVYDKDPKKFIDAKPIKHFSWKEYQEFIGHQNHTPGLKVPVDPIAAKKSQEAGLKVILASGHDLKNLENILEGKPYIGTTLE